MTEIEAVRQRFRAFAEAECRGYSDLYELLSTGVADSDELVRFIAARPVTQPNLFFAAVHYLCGPANKPATPSELAGFVTAHATDIVRLMERRRTQTNEVGRCAILLPALPPGPLALLEVGAGAGLCRLLDRFCYDYAEARVGDSSSTVRCGCRLTGLDVSAIAMPEIAWRRGLDRAPIDVRRDEDAEWLLACVWADRIPRCEVMPMSMRPAIRPATEHDAAVLLAIYRPFVESTAASFETVSPSVDEFAARIAKVSAGWRWLVAERDGRCVGYAYASAHRERSAYRWSVEVSAYVDPAHHRQGVGRALYQQLLGDLAEAGFCNAYAGITLPNEGSLALHRSVGFESIGVFKSVGRKFGQWHDVAWLHRRLRDAPLEG